MVDTSDLLGSLMSQLGGGGVDQIARSVGVSGGDGSSMDDIVKMRRGLLGGLFGGK